MSYSPADDLRDRIYQKYLGIPASASTGHESEASSFDMLHEVVKGYEMGDYDLPEVKAIFKAHVPDFDLEGWIAKQIESGDYSDDALNDEPTYSEDYKSPLD